MNRGDARVISLNIKVAGVPVEQDFADEIELTFNPQNGPNCIKKLLSNGSIEWNGDKYVTYLTQEDTFKLMSGNNSYQLRVKKGINVISSTIKNIKFGRVNSIEVLESTEVQENDT